MANPKPTALREYVTQDGEIIEQLPETTSLAQGLARAEIDQQIATAHKFPRSVARALSNIKTLATLDEQTAEECTYALPRAEGVIEGPSVRFAEIVQQSWGNNRVAARVTHVDRIEMFVEAEGVYHDLETNSAMLARVRRRISNKYGKLYNEDMILVTGNAAAAIARRNAILAGVPKPIWKAAHDASRAVVMGDIQTLSARRKDALQKFQRFGIEPPQVFYLLKVAGEADITREHFPAISSFLNQLKSGEQTKESLLGEAGKVEKPASAEQPKREDFTEEKQPDQGESKSDDASQDQSPGPGAVGDAPNGGTGADTFGPADAIVLGEQAFRDRRPRRAPEDYTAACKEAWLAGYDREANEAKAKAAASKPRK